MAKSHCCVFQWLSPTVVFFSGQISQLCLSVTESHYCVYQWPSLIIVFTSGRVPLLRLPVAESHYCVYQCPSQTVVLANGRIPLLCLSATESVMFVNDWVQLLYLFVSRKSRARLHSIYNGKLRISYFYLHMVLYTKWHKAK